MTDTPTTTEEINEIIVSTLRDLVRGQCKTSKANAIFHGIRLLQIQYDNEPSVEGPIPIDSEQVDFHTLLVELRRDGPLPPMARKRKREFLLLHEPVRPALRQTAQPQTRRHNARQKRTRPPPHLHTPTLSPSGIMKTTNTMKTLPDTTARDHLLFGTTPPIYSGGVAPFEIVTLETLKSLQQIGCLDPEGYFNCSPTIECFMDFMESHPGFTAHGYAYHPERFEEFSGLLESINIEGIEYRRTSRDPQFSWETTQDFVLAFRTADEFEWEPDLLYCWYD